MSRVCDVCGKGVMHGNTVSKSNIKTRRTWRPNLHKVKTVIGGTTVTLKVCTRCIKSDYIVKKVKVPKVAAENN